jgi:hypothetical protein
MEIATALGSFEAAVILQQLHYWTQKEGIGVIIDQTKYIYNTFKDWVSQQFTFLTEWKFRKGMNILRSLSIVRVIRYKSRQWNQTNYYNLDYGQLQKWAVAQSIEISELRSSTDQDEGTQTLEMRNKEVSLYGTKNTAKKETTKQKSDRLSSELDSIAAVTSKDVLKKENSLEERLEYSDQLIASPGANKAQSEQNKSNTGEETNVAKVDYIINSEWSKLIPELDGAGIPINRTIKDLLKLYPREKVEEAIALLKVRKREKHIPNIAGYFVAAVKGDWGGKQIVESPESTGEIDTAAVFRHWYDLARELGYCSGQEVRDADGRGLGGHMRLKPLSHERPVQDGEQWVNLSGSWERWNDTVERGYSLEYLRKIMKRNRG